MRDLRHSVLDSSLLMLSLLSYAYLSSPHGGSRFHSGIISLRLGVSWLVNRVTRLGAHLYAYALPAESHRGLMTERQRWYTYDPGAQRRCDILRNCFEQNARFLQSSCSSHALLGAPGAGRLRGWALRHTLGIGIR